nr:proline-rich proteoglycan 2-like [Equus caballus]
MSGAGSCAGRPARSSLRAHGPGWEGAPRPLRPPPSPARGKQQERGSLPPPIQAGARLPLPWPGGGLYAESALPGAPSRVRPDRGRSAELGPPRAHSARDGRPESRGQLGPAEPRSCRRRPTPSTPLTPGPPAAPSPALRLQLPEERREPEGQAAKLQISGSPRRPGLAPLGILICFPALSTDARPPSLPFFTLCRTKASPGQEKDDPGDLPAKTSRETPALQLTG